MQPLLSDVAFTFCSDEKDLIAIVDHDDLTDLVRYILEDLVGTGAGAIILKIQRKDSTAIITLTGTGITTLVTAQTGRGFLGRLCDRAGGTLSCGTDGDRRQYTIRIAG
jgi:hypothetical protein